MPRLHQGCSAPEFDSARHGRMGRLDYRRILDGPLLHLSFVGARRSGSGGRKAIRTKLDGLHPFHGLRRDLCLDAQVRHTARLFKFQRSLHDDKSRLEHTNYRIRHKSSLAGSSGVLECFGESVLCYGSILRSSLPVFLSAPTNNNHKQ